MNIRIGKLAEIAQCPVVTIRFYEKEGLLKPKRRGNYREYGSEDIDRLRFIIHCRMHGMKLGKIRELLAVRDNPARDCAAAHKILEEHLQNVEEQIARLNKFKEELLALKAGGSACETDNNGCPLMNKLGAPDCCAYCENLRRLEKTEQ